MARLITSSSELSKALDEAKQKLVVLNVSATWCGPCKMIAPVYDEMASRYAQKCVLLRTYADKDPDVSASYGVRGYPTFIFIHQRNEVDRMSGADASGLEAKIQSLSERYVRLFMTGPGAGTVGGDEDDEELKELERKWHEERAAQGLPPRKFNPWLLPEYRKKLAQQIKSPTNASASSTDTAAAPAAAGSSSNTTSPPRPSASAAAAGSAAAAPAAASSEKSWPPLSPEAESIRRQLQDNFGFSARSAYAAAQRNKTLEDALTWITDPANENVGPDLSQAAAAPAAAGAGAGAGIGAAAAGASAGAAGKVDSEELNDFALVRSVMKELDGKKRTPGARTSLEDLAAIQKARATGQAPPPRPAAATESAAAPSAEVEHKQPQSATEQAPHAQDEDVVKYKAKLQKLIAEERARRALELSVRAQFVAEIRKERAALAAASNTSNAAAQPSEDSMVDSRVGR